MHNFKKTKKKIALLEKKRKIYFQTLIEIQAFLAVQLKLLNQILKNIDAKRRCFFLKIEANGENIYTKIFEANELKKNFSIY